MALGELVFDGYLAYNPVPLKPDTNFVELKKSSKINDVQAGNLLGDCILFINYEDYELIQIMIDIWNKFLIKFEVSQ